METIEEFFKNRVSFTPNSNQPIPTFFSENCLKPEDYSIDLLKEKTKSFCYYLYSVLNIDRYINEIHLQEDEEFADLSIQSEKIVEIDCPILEGNRFLWTFEDCFNHVKAKFCHQIPSKPFEIKIMISVNSANIVARNVIDLSNLLSTIETHPPDHNFTGPGTLLTRRLEEEEEEKQIIIINTELTFKSNECVICLTNPPSVLFRNADICAYAQNVTK